MYRGRPSLLDLTEYYQGLAQRYATLRLSLSVMMALLSYGMVIWLIRMFPPEVLVAENLLLVIDILKFMFFLLLAYLFFAAMIFSSKILSPAAYFASFATSFFIVGFSGRFATVAANPASLIGAFSAQSIIYSVIMIGFIIAMLLLLGFLRRGALENLILAYFLIFAGVSLAFTFSGTEVLAIKKISELQNLWTVILDPSFALFVILFAIFEVGGAYSQTFNQLRYLSERLRRISNQILGVYQVKEAEEVEEREVGGPILAEGGRLFEKLSPLATAMLRDAYAGYAFLGEGTSLYVSSKLKSYVSFQLNKNPELLDEIAGVSLSASLSVGTILTSTIIKLILSLGIIIASLLVSSHLLSHIGQGLIVESSMPVAFVVGTWSVIFMAYILAKVALRT